MDDVKEFSRVLVTKAAAVRRVKMAVNPALLGAGAGAALGGVLGGGTSLRNKEKRKHLLGNTLHGAMLGAGVGAGAAGLSGLLKNLPSGGGGGLSPGIDASAVAKELDKTSPSLLDRAKGMVTAPFSAVSSYASNHPFLATLAGVDAMSHGVGTAANAARNVARVPSANPEDFTRGLDRLIEAGGDVKKWEQLKSTYSHAPDRVQELLLKARQSNAQSVGLSPSTAAKVPDAAAGAAPKAMDLDAMIEKAQGGPFATGDGAKSLAATKAKRTAAGKPNAITNNLTDWKPIPGEADGLTAQEIFNITRKGQDPIQPGGYRDLVDLLSIGRNARATAGGANSHNARLIGGTPADFGRAVSATGDAVSNLPQGDLGTGFSRITNWLRSPASRRLQSDFLTGAPRASSLTRAIVPRLALYLGVPAAQMVAGNWFKQLAEQRRLDQLLGQQG
jgi:hypothetical protein